MGTKNPNRVDHERLVLQSAISSRIVLLTLITLWRSLLTPYDTSASINPNCLTTTTTDHRVLFPRVAAAIENGIVWDSVFFVRIAQCGYEYEHTYAFLPLLPFCISLLSRTVFAPLSPVIGHRAVLALSGYALSNLAFVLAALYLYRLSIIILKDPEAAVRASILFCFNPASIFYSSIYSESLYALLSVGGLYHLMSGANNFAVLWLALSGSARSNGVLNAGYIGFQTMHRAYGAFFLKKNPFLALQVLIAGALRCVFVFVPFIAFQAYGYYNICLGRSSDRLRPWCGARLPLLYNFIQSHYCGGQDNGDGPFSILHICWVCLSEIYAINHVQMFWGELNWILALFLVTVDVGFLRYFQIKQLPNFLLALPILSLALSSIIHYVKLFPEAFYSLGFRSSVMDDKCAPGLFSFGADTESIRSHLLEKETSEISQEDHSFRLRKRTIKEEGTVKLSSDNRSTDKLGNTSIVVLPFVLHLAFMAGTAFFVMHVQVATRFLSASPLIYWFAAYLMVSPSIGKRWGYLIWGYCAAYILLGSLLFSNFYPFT